MVAVPFAILATLAEAYSIFLAWQAKTYEQLWVQLLRDSQARFGNCLDKTLVLDLDKLLPSAADSDGDSGFDTTVMLITVLGVVGILLVPVHYIMYQLMVARWQIENPIKD